MGADGGVSWVKLKNPKEYKRLLELIEPFHATYHQNCSASGHDDEHWQFLKENKELSAPEYLLGVYGTDMGDIPDLRDIESIVEFCEDRVGMNSWGINVETNTFLDLMEERETRPSGWFGWHASDGRAFILKIMEYYDFDKGETIRNEPVFKMTLASWAQEIRNIVGEFFVHSSETWT